MPGDPWPLGEWPGYRPGEEDEMRTIERTVWTCENCRSKNTSARKRCTDCGTTRD